MGDESSPKQTPVVPLSQWLRLMLAEIDRKRAEQEGDRTEAALRASEREPAAGPVRPGCPEIPPLP